MKQSARKRYLFLSPFFFPEPISTGKWNTYLADALAKEAELEVVCFHPLYPAWKIEASFAQREGIHIHRFGARLKFGKSTMVRRAVLESSYVFCVTWFLIRHRKRFDAVVSVFPPSLFMLSVAAMFKGRRIGVVHDLQGIYAARQRGLFGRLLHRLISLIERRAFLACEKLIFLSKEMQDQSIGSYGLDPSRCSISYPFITVDSFVDNQRVVLCDESRGEWSLVYSGALGEKQAPSELVALMKKVAEIDSNCKPYIFSAGPVFESLRNDDGNSLIEFRALVPEDDLPELLAKSSIQVLPQAKGTSSGSLPSKLPNLIAAKTKLFVVTDEGAELAGIVEGVPGVSVGTSWDDIESLARDILALYELPDEYREASKVAEKFRIDNLVEKVLEDC